MGSLEGAELSKKRKTAHSGSLWGPRTPRYFSTTPDSRTSLERAKNALSRVKISSRQKFTYLEKNGFECCRAKSPKNDQKSLTPKILTGGGAGSAARSGMMEAPTVNPHAHLELSGPFPELMTICCQSQKTGVGHFGGP